MDRPFYVVFAGVNGAGKSTFYHSGLWRLPEMPKRMARINPDEILLEQGGDWRSASDQLKAGREAKHRIDELFRRRQSFNQETTLTGRTALKRIRQAHELGYRVFLNYVGVEAEAVALSRIEHRVELGGHDVDAADVHRRFLESLRAFSLALGECEQATAYDNTEDFKALAYWKRGVLAWWAAENRFRPWLFDAIMDEALWRQGAPRIGRLCCPAHIDQPKRRLSHHI